MKRTVRIIVITVLITAIGITMMFVTPGTLMVGTNVYSNTYEDTAEQTLRKYYNDDIKLKQSICKAETENTCLFLYFNGKTVSVCKMIKKDGKYCYYGQKIKFKYTSDYMSFDKNEIVINDDKYIFDIVYQNRTGFIDNDFKKYNFSVNIEDVETRNLTFAYKICEA